MSYIEQIINRTDNFAYDANSRTRVAQLTTVFDGKTLNADNPYLWNVAGTGTGTWGSNKFNMSVTSGQWYVRQSRCFHHYFSGKSQISEITFDGFGSQANVVKRVGRFSSNAVSPFDSTYDGFYLENDGTTIRLKVDRAGTSVLNLAWTSWDNYNLISSYDWNDFTVIAFDFVWLGGAILRLFLKTDRGFILAHTYHYSGNSLDTMTLSPNKPLRYEIRSSTGTGSFRPICAMEATEGSLTEIGLNGSIASLLTAGVPQHTVATIGTTYPVKGIRLKTTHRDVCVKVTDISFLVNSADQARWEIHLNPTLSGALTWTDVADSAIQEANGSAVAAISTTVTTPGRILAFGYCTQNNMIPSGIFQNDYLSQLGTSLTNVSDQIILCVTPITATVSVSGVIRWKQF